VLNRLLELTYQGRRFFIVCDNIRQNILQFRAVIGRRIGQKALRGLSVAQDGRQWLTQLVDQSRKVDW
jgi:hypothetical protein